MKVVGDQGKATDSSPCKFTLDSIIVQQQHFIQGLRADDPRS